MSAGEEAKRALLRHTVATLAYRASKPLRDAPDSFGTFRACESARTPVEILAHLGDLFDWGLSIAQGQQKWYNSAPLDWDSEVERFFETLRKFDAYVASEEPLHESAERLFQGPVADALTHVGQIAMIRRLADKPIKGENYHKADIAAGRVGREQEAPKFEF